MQKYKIIVLISSDVTVIKITVCVRAYACACECAMCVNDSNYVLFSFWLVGFVLVMFLSHGLTL